RKAEFISRASARLGRSMTVGHRGLLELATGAKSEAVRRAACRDLLDLAVRVRQAETIEQRLEELETLLGGGPNGGAGRAADETGGPGPEAAGPDVPGPGPDPGGPDKPLQV